MAKSKTTTKIDTVDSKTTKAIAKKPSEDRAEIAKKKRLVATEQILELISQGLSQTDAISIVGISYSTFHSWMKADAELVADVKRAEISLKLSTFKTFSDILKAMLELPNGYSLGSFL
jgi:uncharacterized protein YoaH (UPF0181 family)